MSLPDTPNTLREKYYSVMAGQNDADILPDIDTAPSTENRYLDYIARNGGGGGGDVTKEYVDTAIATAVAVKVDKVEGKGLSTNDYTNADKALVQDSLISSTSTTSPLTDSADGMVQGVTVYGRSEVVDGSIRSVGEGWATVDLGTLNWTYQSTTSRMIVPLHDAKIPETEWHVPALICSKYYTEGPKQSESASIDYCVSLSIYGILIAKDTNYTDPDVFKSAMSGVILCYQQATPTINTLAVKTDDGTGIDGTMATFTTALPLRSTLDGATRDELIIGNGKAEVITRCEVVDDSIVPLATPVTTPLTDAEISAFRSLRTYDSTTNITISDDPEFELDYLKNTENGQAIADIQMDLQGQINGLAIKTLTYTGTGTTTNSITFPDKPLMVLGYTQDSDYDTYVRGIMPFFFHPSTAMLRIFWKGKSETSHVSDYTYSSSYVLTINGNSISWIGLDASQALNSNGVEYTLYYI